MASYIDPISFANGEVLKCKQLVLGFFFHPLFIYTLLLEIITWYIIEKCVSIYKYINYSLHI